MNSIVSVNFEVPGCEFVDYLDDRSLRDFDIVLFSPRFPVLERVYFDAGGSCVSIPDSQRLSKAIHHWRNEILEALGASKTVFVVADSIINEQVSYGTESKRKNERTYLTREVENYSSIPVSLGGRSSKGRLIQAKGSMFRNLISVIGDFAEYRSVFGVKFQKDTEICAKDGAALGGVLRLQNRSGALVILPYFEFSGDGFVTDDDDGDAVWSGLAIKKSNALLGQLTAIDRSLRSFGIRTPPPDWVVGESAPQILSELRGEIEVVEQKIASARLELSVKQTALEDASRIQDLLYANGPSLERAIDSALELMGFSVESVRIGDLEIDHVIVGPDGFRMIGESEGKDKSAIDIKKFRQLESNIGEDFEREDIDEPAKGVLFGNGFRFSPPKERPEQFTEKSLKNAKRLGSALVRTCDLYKVAVYIIDNPDDEGFKSKCRAALIETSGSIVAFPAAP